MDKECFSMDSRSADKLFVFPEQKYKQTARKRNEISRRRNQAQLSGFAQMNTINYRYLRN